MAGKKRGVSLGLEALECREVPASISGGNLNIGGSNSVDTVLVKDVTIGGVAKIQVTHNGVTQTFNASSITGKIQFWGYGGNDSFDYYGSKGCFVDGGSGNDYISADKGKDLLLGGTGNDTLEGWGGNDELQGGDGYDTLDGGAGDDRLFGQAGNDLLGGGSGNDQIVGGTGNDVAFGGSGYDQYWEVGNDPGGILLIPIQTRFGQQATSAGVQDAYGTSDTIWS